MYFGQRPPDRPAEPVAEIPTEAHELIGHFRSLGFSEAQALELVLADAPLAEIKRWLRRGCTHEQAVRIAA
jgi:hypothetical protein